ncbi:cupin domain-containing protein [Brevundimonas staleyi]|uniref:Cupin domain-containing protein n=1 Tax=Brevundimonas staleyi TaxID=74326 RepID=A0ABW0FUW3_9CAUL
MPDIASHPIHLGPGGTAVVQSPIDGPDWYLAYAARHLADGAEGWLVAQHGFDRSWAQWEVHPHGAEIVLCLSGRLTLIQQAEGTDPVRVELRAGGYAINAPGVWHTADLAEGETAVCLFITPGAGTDHRPR